MAACEELDIEKENIPKWKAFISKLPPYLINEQGQLQEWAVKGATENFNHRHHSTFLTVYQFCEFDPEKTPEFWQAAQRSFEGKVRGWLRNGRSDSKHITHGMANQGQCAARFGRGDIVYEVLEKLVDGRGGQTGEIGKSYILPNFMMYYWSGKSRRCFGMDPIGTIPDFINNALLFMWDGTLDILPALPEQWSEGSISGILLRNQITANECVWRESGRQVELSMTSKKGQEITIRFPAAWKITSVKVVEGGAKAKPIPGREHCHSLKLPANEVVTLQIATEVAASRN